MRRHVLRLHIFGAYMARGGDSPGASARTETKNEPANLEVEGIRDITVVLYLGRLASISAVSHHLHSLKFLTGLSSGWGGSRCAGRCTAPTTPRSTGSCVSRTSRERDAGANRNEPWQKMNKGMREAGRAPMRE